MRLLSLFVFLSLVFQTGIHSQDTDDWYHWTEDGHRMYVSEMGSGNDTLVVVHGGWGAEHSYLIPAFEKLANEYHLIFYDQRGSLRSPAPDSSITLENLVEDLESLRKELDLNSMNLATHSMGSHIAYGYLGEYDDKLKKLILISPVLPVGASYDRSLKRESDGNFVRFADSLKSVELKEEGLNRDDLNSKEKTHAWKIGFASGNLFHIDRWRSMKGGQAFYKSEVARLVQNNTPGSYVRTQFEDLSNKDIPVYVVMGDHDLVDFGAVIWPGVVEDLNNGHLTLIQNAGHNLWIDQPGLFYDAVHWVMRD